MPTTKWQDVEDVLALYPTWEDAAEAAIQDAINDGAEAGNNRLVELAGVPLEDLEPSGFPGYPLALDDNAIRTLTRESAAATMEVKQELDQLSSANAPALYQFAFKLMSTPWDNGLMRQFAVEDLDDMLALEHTTTRLGSVFDAPPADSPVDILGYFARRVQIRADWLRMKDLQSTDPGVEAPTHDTEQAAVKPDLEARLASALRRGYEAAVAELATSADDPHQDSTWNVYDQRGHPTMTTTVNKTEQEQPVAQRDDQVLDLDEAERSALADELRKYADYREGDLDLDTSERAAELSNDPTYAYDEQATTEALEQEQEQIGQFQQEQIAAATPYRELADQVEQTGRLDLTDDAVRRDVTEVIDRAGWRLDGDAQDAPPQPMQRVVEAVQAPRPQEQPQHDHAPQQAAPERDEYDEPDRSTQTIELHEQSVDPPAMEREDELER